MSKVKKELTLSKHVKIYVGQYVETLQYFNTFQDSCSLIETFESINSLAEIKIDSRPRVGGGFYIQERIDSFNCWYRHVGPIELSLLSQKV